MKRLLLSLLFPVYIALQALTLNAQCPIGDIGGASVVNTGATIALTAPALPTGGNNVYLSGSDRVHIFTTSGTFNVPAGFSGSVEVLIVAGGGGGGANGGGGGGAGSFRYSNNFQVTAGSSFPVAVGSGGTGSSNIYITGTSGGSSSFSTLTTTGGGAGASRDGGGPALNGGSGGGGGGTLAGQSALPGTGTSGYNGGYGTLADAGCNAAGGGGGGAGGSGGSAASSFGGNGGAGVAYATSGTNLFYAAGGGGGLTCNTNSRGLGGNSIGGTGGGTVLATAGAANTGSGGGGGGAAASGVATGGNGGSGVVIIRYGNYAAGTWSSTNNNIATVNASGVVTGVSPGTTTIHLTSGCGSVSYKTVTVQELPTIAAFTPLSAKPGDALTISGTGFNTTAANNVVFFGATRATVSAASVTSLTVTVPVSATYGPITVLNTGSSLAGSSIQYFIPTYSPAKTNITATGFELKQDFATGNSPRRMAIGDLDGDGKPELVVANATSGTVSVYRNTSSSGSITTASFAAKVDFITGSNPYSVAIGDLDGDGKPDLVVANSASGTVSIFRNTSSSGSITTASFAAKVDFITGSQAYSVAIGDLDGDGKPDLAVANYVSHTISVLRNTAASGSITAGSFEAKVDYATGSNPYSIAIGDLDGDGKPDLAVTNLVDNTVSVLRNTAASGSFTPASFAAKVDFTTGSTPYFLAIGDLDRDGKPDLAVANYNSNTVSVFRNTSSSGSITSASFSAKVDLPTGTNPFSVALGDLDGDGKPDLAVTNGSNSTVSVLRNTAASGSLTTASFLAKVDFSTGSNPFSVAIGDLDGDSKPDLAVVNNSSNTISVIRNASVNADLSALALSSGTLNPVFASGTTSYTASVGNAITSITVTPTVADANSTITVNGVATASGTASGAIALNVGANTITVVTAQNGTTKTYMVTLTRALILPVITSFSPLSAKPGDVVTITGTDFNSTAANNVVFFGATRATITAASVTSLTVTVPVSATYGPISVLDKGNGLAGYSLQHFIPTYSPAKTNIIATDFLPKQDFVTGTNPGSVAIGDLDGDGKPDLAVVNDGSNNVSVYRNTSANGNLTAASFAAKVDFTAGFSPVSITIGDLDGDGKPDLAVANMFNNNVSIFRNTSTSGSITTTSFAVKVDFTTGPGPRSVAIGDLDGDGKLDLVVPNGDNNTVSVFRNISSIGSITTSSFEAKVDFVTGNLPIALAIGDLDGDGKPDLAVTNFNNSSVSVYRNTSTSGSLTAASLAAKVDFTTRSGPISVAIGDLDGDGKPDLALTNNNSNTVSVYLNTSSSGSLTAASLAAKVDFATGTRPYSVAIGDLDGDGKPDLAVANYSSSTVSVIRNITASGILTTASFAAKVDFTTGANPASLSIGDLDGDGKPDMALTNYNSNTVSVLRNASNNADLSALALSSGTLSPFFASATTSYSALVANANTSITVTPTVADGNATVTVNGVAVTSGSASPAIALSIGANTITTVVTAQNSITQTYTITVTRDFAPPVITSFTPLSAKPGDAVILTGTGFNSTATNNVVFFGATQATVSAASATGLTVTVPVGATFGPVTILNAPNSLTGSSTKFFTPTYNPAKTTFTASDFLPKVDFTTGTNPNAVAIGDLDGDGKPDLAVANTSSNTISVYRNISASGSLSTASFAAGVNFTTGTSPRSLAIGDLDGDGKPDLAVTNYSSDNVSVYRNTATSGSITTGSFAARVNFATGTGPRTVAIGDLDGDGKPELALTNYNSNTISVYRNTAISGSITTGSFAAKVNFATGSSPWSVAIGDLDGDGKPDLAVANAASDLVSVYRNTATSGSITPGSFAAGINFTTGSSPIWVAIGDLDRDGKPELAVANNASNNVSVFHNTATSGSITAASFASKVDFVTGITLQSVAIGDVDGDGKPDLATTNFSSNTVSILRNTATSGISTASFAAKIDFTTGTSPRSVAIGDLDGDGKPDLAVANGGSNNVSVLRNTDLYWTGTIDRDWHTAGNWSGNSIPTLTDAALIPAGLTNYPEVSAAATAKSLTLAAGSASLHLLAGGELEIAGSLTLNSGAALVMNGAGTLTLNGALLNNSGSFTAGLGTVNFKSVSAFTIPAFTFHNLNLQGSNNAVFTTAGSFTVNNNLVLNNSGFSLLNNNTITVKGNVEVNAVQTGTGKIRLAGGTVAHEVSGTAALNNLELDDVIGATLLTDMTVTGALTLTAGNLTAAANSVQLTLNGTITEGMGRIFDGELVKTTSIGSGIANSLFGNIGVGFDNADGGNWGNVTVIRHTGAGSFISNPTAPDLQGINRYWSIEPQFTPTGKTINLTLSWLADENNGLTFANNQAQVWKSEDNGLTWIPVDVLKTVVANGDLRSVTVQTRSFSLWTVSDISNPLPVTWLYFNGKAAAEGNQLNWATATEKDSKAFVVERSLDGWKFTEIGKVNAAGNSNHQLNYSYLDKEVLSVQTAYYRLKQFDHDGSFTYSIVIVVNRDKVATLVSVFPNPSKENQLITVRLSEVLTGAGVFYLYDATGKQVICQSIAKGQQERVISLKGLPAGLYQLKVVNGSFSNLTKVVIQ